MAKEIPAIFMENYILTASVNEARALHDNSCYGEMLKSGQLKLSLLEGLFLHDSGKLQIGNGKKVYSFEEVIKNIKRIEKDVLLRYSVFKDLREKGYVVKTALKFGADFRVYDKGIKPGEDHAKWVVFPVAESDRFSWRDFSAKNRVAHSTKKRLLLGIVDDEGDVTYYEVKWERP